MKSRKQFFDTLQFLGLFLGVLLSIILIFPANQDPVGSVILGLGVTIIFQLFDLQQRQSASEELILQSNILSQEIFRDGFLLKHIRDIVTDYYVVKNGWFELFKLRANDAVLEYRNIMHSMAEGYLIVELNSPFTFGIRGVESATTLVKAVSAEDISIWLDNVGEKYINANANAVKRGVKIVRVFIQPKAVLQEIIDMLKKQQIIGVEIYVASSEDLPIELYEDYLILDDHICVRFELTAGKEAREERITISEVEVDRMNKKFDKLLMHAKKLQ